IGGEKILMKQEKERFKVESETKIRELEKIVNNSKVDYLLMARKKEIEIRKIKDVIQDRNKHWAIVANIVDHYCGSNINNNSNEQRIHFDENC
ncbi:13630_t:CDS:1, partial [Gigaspora rosea]